MKLDAFFETKTKPEYTKEEHPIAYLYRLLGYDIDYMVAKDLARIFRIKLESNNRSDNQDYLNDHHSDFKNILSELVIPEKKVIINEEGISYYSYVPETTLFGNFLRYIDGGWALDKFIKDLIIHGAKDKTSADTLFNELYEALEVKDDYDKNDQDFFSYLISKEIQEWLPHKTDYSKELEAILEPLNAEIKNDKANIVNQDTWTAKKLDKEKRILKNKIKRKEWLIGMRDKPEDIFEFKKQKIEIKFSDWNTNDQVSPSIRFFDGLKSLIDLKPSLTQFQWINLLSGFLRFGITMHELWSCQNRIVMHLNLSRLLYKVKLLPTDKTHSTIPNLVIGQTYDDSIKNIMLNNLKADDFINLFLEYLETNKFTAKFPDFGKINSIKELEEFYTTVEGIILKLSSTDLSDFQKSMKEEMNEKLQSHVAIKHKSLDYFFRHVLKDSEDLKDKTNIDKDQFFWLKAIPGQKYRIEPGDGQCLLMTYLTCGKNRSYCSLQELERYLNGYSIGMEKNDNSTVSRLMKMGLISDNPDSDHGLTIKNPFPIA